MSADLISAGDHVGCASLSRAATPATCGLAIDVPLRRSNDRPLSGETAARMSTPGAATSGLRMSPPELVLGPREENSAMNGAGFGLFETAPIVAVAEPLESVTYFLTAAPSVSLTWIVGT